MREIEQGELRESSTAQYIDRVLGDADLIFLKKLSNNDRDWADNPDKHQAGVYVPQIERDSGFFPQLSTKDREPGQAEIREAFFRTEWPQTGDKKTTRLVNYTSKGVETHLTGVPRAAFSSLSPASWFVIGRLQHDRGYLCLTIDSASEEAVLLLDAIGKTPDFSIGIIDVRQVSQAKHENILSFAEQLIRAWLSGQIDAFANGQGSIPATIELAALARGEFMNSVGLRSLDPFELEAPGDAIRTISRVIEWDLFRKFQWRERAIDLVRLLFGDQPRDLDSPTVISSLVDKIGSIDALMLSASQQRKSRAGYSFEHHIEAVLVDGRIPHQKQVILESKKRPDFVLPSLEYLRNQTTGAAGLILSAKTTLRDRWKQVALEMKDADLFLATVDESISANSIEEMSSLGIVLVVPESLKVSDHTEYVRHDNVVDFRSFFRDEIRGTRLSSW